MIVLSLDGSYYQMVKPLQENFRVKIFLMIVLLIQWTTFLGQNNQKFIFKWILIKVILVVNNNILI
jgi:hypothetical protein